MQQPRLRIFCGPEDFTDDSASKRTAAEQQVTLPLSEIFPLLAEAVRCQRTWLQDFADDQISISTDLYEVILAYQHYRRPSA